MRYLLIALLLTGCAMTKDRMVKVYNCHYFEATEEFESGWCCEKEVPQIYERLFND